MVTWLAERSVDTVRAALTQLCPELGDLPIVLHEMWVETGNPLWARSSAFVGGAWVVKFAWTEPAAIKLEREIRTLRALVDWANACDPIRELAPTPSVSCRDRVVPATRLRQETWMCVRSYAVTGGSACCSSIIEAMTVSMKAVASSVAPPGMPP